MLVEKIFYIIIKESLVLRDFYNLCNPKNLLLYNELHNKRFIILFDLKWYNVIKKFQIKFKQKYRNTIQYKLQNYNKQTKNDNCFENFINSLVYFLCYITFNKYYWFI